MDSHGFPLDYPKPRGTRYLQTWHGQGIKSIGFDAPDLRADFDQPRERWRAAVARWDALVAPSAEFARCFLPSNGYTGKVYRYGTPRCDALVRGEVSRRRPTPAGDPARTARSCCTRPPTATGPRAAAGRSGRTWR